MTSPYKTEDLNLNMFIMIAGINESKTVTKLKLCKSKWKFDSVNCNSNQKWNNDKRRCECKSMTEYCMCVKDYIWNPATSNYENGKYFRSAIDNSVITCDEIIEETKTFTKNLMKKVILQNKKFLYFTYFF